MRAQDLAREFEVNERTIYRDMAALSESGVPIVGTPGEGYALIEGYYFPPLLFTQTKLRAFFKRAHADGECDWARLSGCSSRP